jgi:hypothetical protein
VAFLPLALNNLSDEQVKYQVRDRAYQAQNLLRFGNFFILALISFFQARYPAAFECSALAANHTLQTIDPPWRPSGVETGSR